jgi:SAM-dependent methyltransferase
MFDSYADIFSQRAHSYQKAMTDYPSARDAEFDIMVAPLGAITQLLDMPAGGGYLRRHLPAHIHYTAVEPAQLFFDSCPQDARATRHLSPIESVPMADASVEAIVCLAGLHHAPDLQIIFAEMHRLLHRNGMLVLADVAAGTPQDVFLNHYVHNNSVLGHRGTFLDADTALQLRATGFDIRQDAHLPIPWHFADRVQAGQFCADMFGIEGQSPEQVAAALEDIVGIEQTATGLSINWSLRRIICEARWQFNR